MSQDAETSRLLKLPEQLRRSIMVEVIRHSRSRAPIFNRKFIENRVRVRNCFDKDFPESTNLYVPRRINRYLHGNGLRATNRQLRRELDLAIEEELKSGKVDIPFVLDVMVVKDIGVFPCWISFPYRLQHLKMLTINFRIVRPGTAAVPKEWVEAAKYDKTFPTSEHSPTIRNLLIAISLYAFNCLSIAPDPAPAHIHSDTANANLVTSGHYVTDKLLLNFEGLEYTASGKLITSHMQDTLKESLFYREGYVQFGRDVFVDYSTKWKDIDDIEDEAELISQGMLACYQLENILGAAVSMIHESSSSIYVFYLRVLARSVGALDVSGTRRRHTSVLAMHPGFWVDLRYTLDAETESGRYTKAKIARDLKNELDHGWDEMARNLRTVQIRRSHGWVNDDD